MNKRTKFTRISLLWMAFIAVFVILPALACNTIPIATPAPTLEASIPAGWVCYQNATYGFDVCYPSDATISTSSAEHSRISLSITPDTNLAEKWMDVDSRSGLEDCTSPQSEGYEPGSVDTETRTINGLQFTVESAGEGAAGNYYTWVGYSTERDGVCVSLTGVLHSLNALNFPTPPPEYDPAAESAVFDQIVSTFHWLTVITPAVTLTPISIPAGWICYQNETYHFEVCYPPDATLTDETEDHVRINLSIIPGTNLHEKWMDVNGFIVAPDCASPQAAGFDPASIDSETQTINSLEFLVQSASEGAAGSIYQWTGYSTQRSNVCASLTGILHSVQPGNYSTPPPVFDLAAESAVFDQIVATFRWLDVPTPTPSQDNTPTATLLENANCHRGASIDHETITYLRKGQIVTIVGRNEDSSWWLIQYPGSSLQCWVWGQYVKAGGDLTKVPFVESPPLGCWVQSPFDKKPKCAAPCPDGAKPGGVCEP